MVAWLNPPKRPGWSVLDVAGGTGDVAFRIVEASHGHAHATVLDINGSMLAVGRDRAEKKGLSGNTDFVEANAEELPFADATFDAYTIAFGIRNVPRIDVALSEAYRVLKPGGRFLCLEFSEVDMPLLDKAYEAWSFNAIPKIGKAVTGDGEPYSYLVGIDPQISQSAEFRCHDFPLPASIAPLSATIRAASPHFIRAGSFEAGPHFSHSMCPAPAEEAGRAELRKERCGCIGRAQP